MKIKPDGFALDFDPNNFMQYEDSHYKGFANSGSLNNFYQVTTLVVDYSLF